MFVTMVKLEKYIIFILFLRLVVVLYTILFIDFVKLTFSERGKFCVLVVILLVLECMNLKC